MSTQTLRLEGNPFNQRSESIRPPQSTYKRVLKDIHAYLIKRKDFIFLEGTAGSGRTTLLRNLVSNFDRKTHHVYLHANELTEFTCEPSSEEQGDAPENTLALSLIKDFILAQSRLGSHVVLIIDDASHFSDEVVGCLDDMLSSQATNNHNITIILAGEPDNLRDIQHQHSRIFKQHSMAYTRLSSLTVSDIQQYVSEHIDAVENGNDIVFSFQLCESVHNFTKGDLYNTHRLLQEVFENYIDSADTSDQKITQGMLQESAISLHLTISSDSQHDSTEPVSSNDQIDGMVEDRNVFEVARSFDTLASDSDIAENDVSHPADSADNARHYQADSKAQFQKASDEAITATTNPETAGKTESRSLIQTRLKRDTVFHKSRKADLILTGNGNASLLDNDVAPGSKSVSAYDDEHISSDLFERLDSAPVTRTRISKYVPATAFFAVGLLFGIVMVALLTDIPKLLFQDTTTQVAAESDVTKGMDSVSEGETAGNTDSDEQQLAGVEQTPAEKNNVQSTQASSGEAIIDDASDSAPALAEVDIYSASAAKSLEEKNKFSESVSKQGNSNNPVEFSTLSVADDNTPVIELPAVEIDSQSSKQHPVEDLDDLSSKQPPVESLDNLFAKAERQYELKKLTTPKGDSAYDTYTEILIQDPGNQKALEGIERLKQRYIQWADYAARNGNDRHAMYLYKKALSLDPDNAELASFIVRFDEQRQQSDKKPTSNVQTSRSRQLINGTTDELFEAIRIGDINTVTGLLNDAELVNIRQKSSGFTPLINAAIHGQRAMIKLLLDHNANINLSDNLGNTALMWAIEKEWFDASRYLIQRGAEIEAANQAGGTALHYAAWDGNVSMVQLLLNKNANINRRNVNGTTPLIQAVINGHVDVVKTLIKNDADINLSNDNGWTALMYAARGGHRSITATLLAANADSEVKNNDGLKATDIAKMLGHNDIVALLNDALAVNTR